MVWYKICYCGGQFDCVYHSIVLWIWATFPMPYLTELQYLFKFMVWASPRSSQLYERLDNEICYYLDIHRQFFFTTFYVVVMQISSFFLQRIMFPRTLVGFIVPKTEPDRWFFLRIMSANHQKPFMTAFGCVPRSRRQPVRYTKFLLNKILEFIQ